jgi:hypothetical protein
VIKQFRKAWERNEDSSLDKVMEDFVKNPHHVVSQQLQEETVE